MGSIVLSPEEDNWEAGPANQRIAEEKKDQLYVGLSNEERHLQYRAIKGQLPDLSSSQVATLSNRGLTDSEISSLGFVNWSTGQRLRKTSNLVPGVRQDGYGLMGANGIGIPAHSTAGQILGYQINPSSSSLPKYLWASSRNSRQSNSESQSRPGPTLENGELPLFFWKHPDSNASDVKTVWLCEGGLKSALLAAFLWRTKANRTIAVVGASGNQFCPEQIEHALTNHWHPEKVVLAPDAGAVNNHHVALANQRVLEIFGECKIETAVAWWEQTQASKSLDIDELVMSEGLGRIEYISADEFCLKHAPAVRKKLQPGGYQQAGSYTAAKSSGQYLPGLSLDNHEVTYFQKEDRVETYSTLPSKYIQDRTATGLGKSHAAGLMKPEELFVDQIIYLSNDPYNPTTESLATLPAIRGRDNGRTESTVNGRKEWRRVPAGEQATIAPNCARTNLATVLPLQGIEAVSDNLCKGCMHRSNCAASTDGYSYLFTKNRATKSDHYVAHYSAVPTEFTDDVAIHIDEAGTVPFVLQDTYSFKTAMETIAKVLQRVPNDSPVSENALLIQKVLLEIHEHFEGLGSPRYGMNAVELKPFIDRLPLLTTAELSEYNPQNIEALTDDALMMPQNRVDFKHFRNVKGEAYEQALIEKIIEDNLNPSIFYLLLARVGHNIKIQYGHRGFQVGQLNNRLKKTLQHENVQQVVFLDATENPSKFAAFIGQEVSVIAERPAEEPAKVIIHQVMDLGNNGKTDSETKKGKISSVIEAIKAKHLGKNAYEFSPSDRRADDSGQWFTHTRGSNAAKDCDVLILDGLVAPNLSSKMLEYEVLHDTLIDNRETVLREYEHQLRHPQIGGDRYFHVKKECAHEGFARFYRQEIVAEYMQGIGRARANIRHGEEIHVYILTNFPFPFPIDHIETSYDLMDAQAPEVRVSNEIKRRKSLGLTCQRKDVAMATNLSQSQVQRTEAWQERFDIPVVVYDPTVEYSPKLGVFNPPCIPVDPVVPDSTAEQDSLDTEDQVTRVDSWSLYRAFLEQNFYDHHGDSGFRETSYMRVLDSKPP